MKTAPIGVSAPDAADLTQKRNNISYVVRETPRTVAAAFSERRLVFTVLILSGRRAPADPRGREGRVAERLEGAGPRRA